MPRRKHFAWPSWRKSFSLRQTRGFSQPKLFTKNFVSGAMGIRCGILARLRKMRRRKRPCFALKIGNSERAGRPMLKVKDTLRATVHLSFDGRVFKTYHGPDAHTRFANEVRVLRHLAARGCDFVPRLLGVDEKIPRIITSNCGTRVERIDEK